MLIADDLCPNLVEMYTLNDEGEVFIMRNNLCWRVYSIIQQIVLAKPMNLSI